ncbi:hypothetical protein PG994_009682 [Apiospora phragmitis]|uniref:Uncharacterized protein n=1 Tax=Apiospora phragmitis TaxID=2905665 RepID=A0ABR1U6R9_9PEZI
MVAHRKKPEIVPSELPMQYELYKQMVFAQNVLAKSQADALCLALVLPKLTSLQQLTMSASHCFYEGYTKQRAANEDGCIRLMNFEGEHEGVTTLEVLLDAAARTNICVPRLRVGSLNYRFFEKDPEEVVRLFKPFRDATHIDLRLAIDVDDDMNDVTGDTERCRACLQSGIVADTLKSLAKLQHLSFLLFTIDPRKRGTSLSRIVTPGHRWSHLTDVTLECLDCERSELWDFLLLHKDTLLSVCLSDMSFTKGSWRRILVDMRKDMYIRDPCICGTLVGYSEDGPDEGRAERYQLRSPVSGPDDMRSSVNCYVRRGGEGYPDELPLTKRVVRNYFESHVRKHVKRSEAEDEALAHEAMLDMYRRRQELDRTEPGWDRLDLDSEDEESDGERRDELAWYGSYHDYMEAMENTSSAWEDSEDDI